MTQIAEPKRSGLRSEDDVLHLERPHTRLITVGDRACSLAAIDLWNKLPLKLRGSKTVDTFKSDLQTYLFKYESKKLHVPVYLVRHYCDIIIFCPDIRRRRTLFLMEPAPVYKRHYYYFYYYYGNREMIKIQRRK